MASAHPIILFVNEIHPPTMAMGGFRDKMYSDVHCGTKPASGAVVMDCSRKGIVE